MSNSATRAELAGRERRGQRCDRCGRKVTNGTGRLAGPAGIVCARCARRLDDHHSSDNETTT
jgi:hypothetical protein